MSTATDPRYPIGRFAKPELHSAELRAANIATLEQLPAKLRAVAGSWSDAQLETPYREGGWTARQLIHHIADSHENMAIRFRLALTEDWPTIKAYEEQLWAELADAKSAPIELSLRIIEAGHARLVMLLRSLTEEQWQRGFNHPVNGRADLQTVLALYSWHSRHHTAHLTELAKAKGWQ